MELLLDAVNGLVLGLTVCNIESSRVVGVPSCSLSRVVGVPSSWAGASNSGQGMPVLVLLKL